MVYTSWLIVLVSRAENMQIKILKRQSDSTASAEPASNATTSLTGKQHKSLAERELEYASARYVDLPVCMSDCTVPRFTVYLLCMCRIYSTRVRVT